VDRTFTDSARITPKRRLKNTTQLLKHAQACRAKKCSQLRNKSTSKRQRVVSQKEREDVEKAAMLGDR